QSQYNDGKGIQFSVQFTPLLAPPKSGQKRHKNAKPKPINAIMYIHEENSFINFIGLCLNKFNRTDLTAAIEGGKLVRTPLEFKYSVPRTQFRDIELASNNDFAEMIEQATSWAKAEVKVSLDEIKIPTDAEDDEDDDHEDGDNDAATTKKKKVWDDMLLCLTLSDCLQGPPPEETEQAELIDQLSIMYKCEDRSCRHNICWVSEAASGRHIHLTHQHLRAWAAAIVSSVPNFQECMLSLHSKIRRLIAIWKHLQT
ncbi:hypothetical protein BU15DRAFT_54814, partial [Melanogaster broomeanus]